MSSVSRKWLKVGASLAILLVVLNIALMLHNTTQLRNDSQMIAHTYELQSELSKLISLAIDAETGERGYVITGDEQFLKPYEVAVDRIDSQLERVERLLTVAPEQLERVEELRQRLDNRMQMLQQTIVSRRETGFDLARAVMQTGRGRDEMDAIRAIVRDMLDVEMELLQERSTITAATYWTTLVTGLISGLAVLVAIGSYLNFTRMYMNEREVYAAEIAERSEQLRTTLSSIGDAVVTTDASGKITNMNSVAEKLTGWVAVEAMGRPIDEVVHILDEASRERIINPAHQALSEGLIMNIENNAILIRKDGTECPIDDSASPIRRGDDTIIGCVLVLRDISKRREQDNKLLLSEQTFRGTFDHAPIGIAHVALDGHFLRVNEKLCKMLLYTREEMQSLRFQQVTHVDDVTMTTELVEQLMSAGNSTGALEKRFIAKNGDSVWVKVTVSMMRNSDNETAYFVAMIEDIREWRSAEEMRIRMSALVSSSNDAIIGKSFDGIVTSWNPAAERLFGYTESEMIGRSILTIIDLASHDEELEMLKRLRAGEKIDQYETKRLRKDGTLITVSLNISPIKDSTGKRVGVSTIARDMTERKLAEESLRESESRFRTLADNMSQLAWMADAEGHVYWYNKRWYDFTGTTLEKMQKKGWERVYHPEHHQRVVASMQLSWESGEPWEDMFPLRGHDGKYRWFLSRALPIRDANGKIETWFGSNTDITELKQYEVSLHQARIIAENANHSRGEFLANMSHEIRTPMTAILGHADILAEHIQDPDNLQCVDIIRRNGKFLLEIINDILDLSKIDAGKFQVDRDRVQPDVVLGDVRSLMDVRAEEKRIKFETRIEGMLPSSIETDAVRLRQILLNLVGNAIKFTDSGMVRLSARFLADSNQMQFDVCDTGIGISPEQLNKLFQPFMQADASSTRAYDGTGLGLAISRRLAQALGGDISVCSELGKGSTFALTIDCGSLVDVDFVEPTLIEKHQPDAPTASVNIHGCILVVDDRRDIRFLAQHFIEKAGGRVITATNGQEAIDILTDPSPDETLVDLVVIDMQMPIMDGYDAARELRRRGFIKPIIALTANAMKDDRDKCLIAGCNDYATKPLDGPKLVQMVASYLAQSQAVASLQVK